MKEYALDFLKENGFFETSIEMEDKYDTAEGTVTTSSYLFDSKNRLAYFVDFNVEDINSILKVLREKRNFDYYWFWKEGRIYAFRTFGENKQFIFNARLSGETAYIKSKKDKLSKFSSDNPTALFDVKDIISRFYRNLWYLRLELAKAIKSELDDRERILVAQRLLDRLIFTYFIAEKGIIHGIDKRGNRQKPDARKLFSHLVSYSEDFHNTLNVLFFDYLNDSKKNDMPIHGTKGYSLFIPYLNGGLFRERQITTPAGETIGESEIEIEGFDWNNLIVALNEYNWIIDGYMEAEAENTIGNLTPEILGHIYEKFVISVSELDDVDVDDLKMTKEGELKKGNKKIGAYYTPEVITKYIAENTIFPFVRDKLELDNKYENFADFYNDDRTDADTLSRFNEALKDIKVLDPAVGSGAFPMAAADILFDWRRKCRDVLDDYHLRREIIVNNIHGVDIMEGAVEICMLRLWLWLIAAVDTEKEIEALPNIDFNIFQGNSLIGYVMEKQIADLKSNYGNVSHKQVTLGTWGVDGIHILELFQQRNQKIQEYRGANSRDADILRNEIKNMTEEFNELLNSKLLRELNEKNIRMDDNYLRDLKPFHWIMQFSDVFENGGFDVVFGNPPYGNILKDNEKSIMFEYITQNSSEISANFIERQMNLLKSSGYLGNITTGSIIINKKTTPAHDIIRKNMSICKISFFNTRPAKIFQNVEIRVSIILGKKDSPSSPGVIYTSDAIKFTSEQRKHLLSNMNFESTDGILLGSKIGSNGEKHLALPKVGSSTTRNIMLKLKTLSNRNIINDVSVKTSDYQLEFRKTGGYWLNALLKMPYSSSKIETLSMQTEIERDFCIILINSSLFYLYWSTYSNLRDLPKSLIVSFPCLKASELRPYQDKVTYLRNKISACMLDSFVPDKGQVGEFKTGKCKPTIDEIDDLLGELFGLTKEEINFIQNYDSHIRPNLN